MTKMVIPGSGGVTTHDAGLMEKVARPIVDRLDAMDRDKAAADESAKEMTRVSREGSGDPGAGMESRGAAGGMDFSG